MNVSDRKISKWKKEAKEQGAMYLVVITEVIDRFDYIFTPKFAMSERGLENIKKKCGPHNLTAVHRIYKI